MGFVSRTSCPACGSKSQKALLDVSYSSSEVQAYLSRMYPSWQRFKHLTAEAVFVVVECHNCGLVFQKSIPDSSLMEILYEKMINPEDALERHQSAGPESLIELAHEISSVISFLNRTPRDLAFLDYSAGWGEYAKLAKGFGCEVSATEFSQTRRAYLKQQGITVLMDDNLEPESFDYINTEQVFEHLPEIRFTLRTLVKALKPGGLLKLGVPNGWDVRRRLRVADWSAEKNSRNSLNPVSPMEHIQCFTRKSLILFAGQAGLEPVWPITRTITGPHSLDPKNILRRAFRLATGTGIIFRKTES